MKFFALCSLSLLLAPLCAVGGDALNPAGEWRLRLEAADPLEAGFASPPEQTKPWCYWYWISDNLSKEGNQPWEDKVPGVNAWFGTEFNRHNTWFEQSKAWVDYLRRSCWLLQQGTRVADVAFFIGEDAPKMTGVRKPELPAGRDFDYINADVIEKTLAVKTGVLTLPHGTSYRVLVLPELETMRPEVLRKIRDLVKAGATVLGPPPSRSPSLENFPRCDVEVRKLAAELWGDANTQQPGERPFGKGRVVWGKSLEQVLDSLGSEPDFESSAKLRFTHRRSRETDIYFVANPKAESLTTTAAFRAGVKAPEFWWPDSGKIERPAVYDVANEVVRLPLSFGPYGSVFVVFRSKAAPKSERIVSVKRNGREVLGTTATLATAGAGGPAIHLTKRGRQRAALVTMPGDYELMFADGKSRRLSVSEVPPLQALAGPWEVNFTPGWGAPERATFNQLVNWTQHHEDGIKHYSGRATYRKTFELPASRITNQESRMVLDLGKVRDLATVRLNGKELGTLWLAPFRVDITRALRPGANVLEVEVVNVWNNRLVGDLALPMEQRRTFLLAPTVNKGAPLLPAGLIGPVTLQTVQFLNVRIR